MSPFMRKHQKITRVGMIITLSVMIDQITKYVAVLQLQDHNTISVLGDFLTLNLHINRALAFNAMTSILDMQFIITLNVIVCMMLIRHIALAVNTMQYIGLTLICSGGLGNLVDRIAYHGVIDFIALYALPLKQPYIWHIFDKSFTIYPVCIFNIADVIAVIGLVLYIFSQYKHRYNL